MQGIGVWFQGCGPHLVGYVPGTAHPAGSGSPAKESGEKEDGICVPGDHSVPLECSFINIQLTVGLRTSKRMKGRGVWFVFAAREGWRTNVVDFFGQEGSPSPPPSVSDSPSQSPSLCTS